MRRHSVVPLHFKYPPPLLIRVAMQLAPLHNALQNVDVVGMHEHWPVPDRVEADYTPQLHLLWNFNGQYDARALPVSMPRATIYAIGQAPRPFIAQEAWITAAQLQSASDVSTAESSS
jgi:hypothetical protein